MCSTTAATGHKTHLFPQLSYKNCSFVLDLEPHKSELIED